MAPEGVLKLTSRPGADAVNAAIAGGMAPEAVLKLTSKPGADTVNTAAAGGTHGPGGRFEANLKARR